MAIRVKIASKKLNRLLANLQAEIDKTTIISQSWYTGLAFCLGQFSLCLGTLVEGDFAACEATVTCIEKYVGEFYEYPPAKRALDKLLQFWATVTGGSPPPPPPPIGGPPMAFPVINPAACSTSSRRKGVCCTALTTLGAAVAATGFSYTDCHGKVRCAKCGVVPSTSQYAAPGTMVFEYRATSCGPSGCPALIGQGSVPVAA